MLISTINNCTSLMVEHLLNHHRDHVLQLSFVSVHGDALKCHTGGRFLLESCSLDTVWSGCKHLAELQETHFLLLVLVHNGHW